MSAMNSSGKWDGSQESCGDAGIGAKADLDRVEAGLLAHETRDRAVSNPVHGVISHAVSGEGWVGFGSPGHPAAFGFLPLSMHDCRIDRALLIVAPCRAPQQAYPGVYLSVGGQQEALPTQDLRPNVWRRKAAIEYSANVRTRLNMFEK